MQRIKVTQDSIDLTLTNIVEWIEVRIQKHGAGALVSNHEIFGVLSEEMSELADEMHKNSDIRFQRELIDVAVAAIFGVASIIQTHKEKLKNDQ